MWIGVAECECDFHSGMTPDKVLPSCLLVRSKKDAPAAFSATCCYDLGIYNNNNNSNNSNNNIIICCAMQTYACGATDSMSPNHCPLPSSTCQEIGY